MYTLLCILAFAATGFLINGIIGAAISVSLLLSFVAGCYAVIYGFVYLLENRN